MSKTYGGGAGMIAEHQLAKELSSVISKMPKVGWGNHRLDIFLDSTEKVAFRNHIFMTLAKGLGLTIQESTDLPCSMEQESDRKRRQQTIQTISKAMGIYWTELDLKDFGTDIMIVLDGYLCRAFERKAGSDFESSIANGHLRDQIPKMMRLPITSKNRLYFLLENVAFRQQRLPSARIVGTETDITVECCMTILHTYHMDDTLFRLLKFVTKIQRNLEHELMEIQHCASIRTFMDAFHGKGLGRTIRPFTRPLSNVYSSSMTSPLVEESPPKTISIAMLLSDENETETEDTITTVQLRPEPWLLSAPDVIELRNAPTKAKEKTCEKIFVQMLATFLSMREALSLAPHFDHMAHLIDYLKNTSPQDVMNKIGWLPNTEEKEVSLVTHESVRKPTQDRERRGDQANEQEEEEQEEEEVEEEQEEAEVSEEVESSSSILCSLPDRGLGPALVRDLYKVLLDQDISHVKRYSKDQMIRFQKTGKRPAFKSRTKKIKPANQESKEQEQENTDVVM